MIASIIMNGEPVRIGKREFDDRKLAFSSLFANNNNSTIIIIIIPTQYSQ